MAVLFTFSCYQDLDDYESHKIPYLPEKEVVADLTGLVFNENGDALSEVEIGIAGQITGSGTTGFYGFQRITVNAYLDQVCAKKIGYFDSYANVQAYAGESNDRPIYMHQLENQKLSNPEKEIDLTMNKDISFIIHPLTIVDLLGKAEKNTVISAISEVDNIQEWLRQFGFPLLRDEDGEMYLLECHAVARLFLKGHNGDARRLASELSMTINDPERYAGMHVVHMNEAGRWERLVRIDATQNIYKIKPYMQGLLCIASLLPANKIEGNIRTDIAGPCQFFPYTLSTDRLVDLPLRSGSKGHYRFWTPRDKTWRVQMTDPCGSQIYDETKLASSDHLEEDIVLDVEDASLLDYRLELLACVPNESTGQYFVCRHAEDIYSGWATTQYLELDFSSCSGIESYIEIFDASDKSLTDKVYISFDPKFKQRRIWDICQLDDPGYVSVELENGSRIVGTRCNANYTLVNGKYDSFFFESEFNSTSEDHRYRKYVGGTQEYWSCPDLLVNGRFESRAILENPIADKINYQKSERLQVVFPKMLFYDKVEQKTIRGKITYLSGK